MKNLLKSNSKVTGFTGLYKLHLAKCLFLQEVTSAVQEVEPDTRKQHERSVNTPRNDVNIPNTTLHEVNTFTNLEKKNPVSLQARAEETQTEIQTQTTQDHPAFTVVRVYR